MKKPQREVTGNPWMIRDLNRRLIVNALKENAPISRADLAKTTNLSLPTVTRIIDDLCAEGLVTELGKGSSTGGRPPVMLEFNAAINYVAGVHIGERKTRVALADLDGNIVESVDRPHPRQRDYRSVVKQTAAEIAGLMEHNGRAKSNLVAIGLAIPGMVDSERGVAIKAVNMPGWIDAPIQDLMQKEWDVPVFVDKEPNMAALGEHWRGAGAGSDNLVYLDLGTGIGAGIIVEGRLYHGSHYAAGEIGFMGLGQRCLKVGQPDRGQMEVLASFDAVLRKVAAAVQAERGGEASDEEVMAEIARANQNLQGPAGRALKKVGEIMGIAIANICTVLDPDLVIVGGESITLAGPAIIKEIHRAAGFLLPLTPKIAASSLGERAPILGAIRVVLDHANYVLAANK